MKIESVKPYNTKINSVFKSAGFKKIPYTPTLKHTNIGNCFDGYIGKVLARKADGTKCYLNVFKKRISQECEKYTIKDDKNTLVGEMDITINKFFNYDKTLEQGDPSHVFVSELINYTNPTFPGHISGEYYKDVGTRLMQIAQRRSDEAMCEGNIKLIAKNESKDWYKKIGMIEEFPAENDKNYRFRIHNPNSMILPPEAKEPLSRRQGGL